MKRLLVSVLTLVLLSGCSFFDKPKEKGPFGLWMGMDREDINECCQVEQTATLPGRDRSSAEKLAIVPDPDPLFKSYYVLFSRSDGVFGVVASSGLISYADAEAGYQQLIGRLSQEFGAPMSGEQGELVWNQINSRTGIIQIAASRQDKGDTSVFTVTYLFKNSPVDDKKNSWKNAFGLLK